MMMRLMLTALALGVFLAAGAYAERMEEATVYGKDQSDVVGEKWSDTQPVSAQSKLDRSDVPSGKAAKAPGVRSGSSMDKPEMDKSGKAEKGAGWSKMFWIILGLAVIAAAAG